MKHVGLTREEMTRYTGVTVGDNAPGHPRVIANATGSIGLCKLGQSHQGGQGWYAVRLVKFNGMEPVIGNLTNKAYPLFHLLYLISKGEPTGGQPYAARFPSDARSFAKLKLCAAGIGSVGIGQGPSV